MPLDLNIQFTTILYSILGGSLIGILFDLYNILRGVKIPKVLIVIQDILFWILTSITVFTFLLYKNYAFLSIYVYLFMIITLLIYLIFISPFVIKIENYLIDKFLKVFRVVLKNIIYPFKLLYYNMYGKK